MPVDLPIMDLQADLHQKKWQWLGQIVCLPTTHTIKTLKCLDWEQQKNLYVVEKYKIDLPVHSLRR